MVLEQHDPRVRRAEQVRGHPLALLGAPLPSRRRVRVVRHRPTQQRVLGEAREETALHGGHRGAVDLVGVDDAGGGGVRAVDRPVDVEAWEQQVLSARGFKRVGRHSEYAT